VELEVHDHERAVPPCGPYAEVDKDGEGGRGLAIVEALTNAITFEQIQGDGKIIRAIFTGM
jgi:hypothetical protein